MRVCFDFDFDYLVWYAVFHVTDQLGSKLTDESLILYIQQVSLSLRPSYLYLNAFAFDMVMMLYFYVITK